MFICVILFFYGTQYLFSFIMNIYFLTFFFRFWLFTIFLVQHNWYIHSFFRRKARRRERNIAIKKIISEVIFWESDEAEEISAAAAAAAIENYCPSDDNKEFKDLPNIECNHCNSVFLKKKYLLKHVQDVHPECLVCIICNQKFSSELNLMKHERMHINNESTEEIQLQMEGKITKREKKKEKCEICDNAYPKWYLKSHMMSHTGERPFICSYCDKAFGNNHQLQVHIRRIHLQNYSFICSTCGKGFGCLSKLEDHERVHRGERPYSCDVCGKAFFSMSHLKSHATTHAPPMQVECDVCHKKYSNVVAMKEHKKQHSSEYKNRFKCTLCPKGFFKKQQLSRHILSHSNVKPFKCDRCGIAYKTKDLLIKHLNKHKEVKTQVCTICSKAYFVKKNLVRHMIAAHKEIHAILYKCDICDHVLSTERSLIEHKLKKHGPSEEEIENTLLGLPDDFFLDIPYMLDDNENF
jgi:KRAB domain-containing zinc finger protein